MQKKFAILFFLLSLITPLQAVELDDRLVILMVGAHRNGDPQLDSLRANLLASRDKLGLTSRELPLVTMGFADSDTEAEYFQRLGFSEGSAPVLCLVRWGNPARFGPKEIVNDVIFRQAQSEQVSSVLNSFLAASGTDKPVATGPAPKTIEIEQFAFELPTELQLLPNSEGERLFGPASSLLGQKVNRGNASFQMVATTKETAPQASLALVQLRRKKNTNRRMRRMAKMFSRKVAGQEKGGALVGPTVEEIRGRRYYKFEQQLTDKQEELRREIYFHAPSGGDSIFVFTFQTNEQSFVEMSPLFRDTVESFDFKDKYQRDL